MAAPGAFYTLVKSVPGFLEMPPNVSLVLRNFISLFTAFLTSCCIPTCSILLHGRAALETSLVELQSMGKLLAAVLVPCAATILSHSECFGGWTSMWALCSVDSNRLGEIECIHRMGYADGHGSLERVVTRSDICSMNHVVVRSKCAHALLDRMAPLLLGGLFHLAFTTSACKMLLRKRYTLTSAWVLVVYVWQQLVMLAPSVPLVVLPLLSILTGHRLLFFEPAHQLDSDTKVGDPIPRVSPKITLGCAALLQFCLASETVLFAPLLVVVGSAVYAAM
eukprot:6458147-Amphidinium_carterae.1